MTDQKTGPEKAKEASDGESIAKIVKDDFQALHGVGPCVVVVCGSRRSLVAKMGKSQEA